MNRIPVKSSQIASIGYNPSLKILEVEFNQGNKAVYQYFDVPPKIHAELMGEGKKPEDNHSVGSYFIRVIKKQPHIYPYKKIEDAAAQS